MDVIYVLNGGELFREELNAIVSLVGSRSWDTLFRSMALIGICAAITAYIRSHDIFVLLRFVVTFMLITSVLVIPKRNVQIIDISNPARVYQVDNVPLGIAGPASIITSMGYGVSQLYDQFFSLPDSVAYNKTGMLFGSNLLARANGFQSQNARLDRFLTEYIRSCAIPDIYLNKKYTLDELMHSKDPYSLLFIRPSPLRHIITPGENDGFLVCKDAAEEIKRMMNPEVSIGGKTFKYYSMLIFKDRPNPEIFLREMLGTSYTYFMQGGDTASDIMKKNITMRLIRQGIENYAASYGDAASLVALSSETSLAKMRMSHRTGYEIASTMLPLLHTVLLSLILGLFPVIIMLGTINIYSWKVISGYIFSIAYLMSWPIMFTILNHAMSIYARTTLGGVEITMSNADYLAQQRSDLAGVAGWISLSIPFLAAGIVRGLSAAVSQAGSYMGNAMQSSASASASQAVDGNWSFNNMQTDNVNGFKRDTNMVDRTGAITQQLPNNSTQTHTPGGGTVLDTSSAMSRTPLDINFGKLQSAEVSRQVSEGHQRSESLARGYTNSLNSAINAFSQFNKQFGKDAISSASSENSQAASFVQAQSDMVSAAERYGKTMGMSTQEAYQELQSFGRGVNASARAEASVSAGLSLFGSGARATGSAGLGAQASYNWSDQKTQNLSVEDSKRLEEARSAAKDFRESYDLVRSNRLSDSDNLSNSETNSLLKQASTSLSEAHNKFDEFRANESRTHNLEELARTSSSMNVNQHSNVNQEFVRFVQDKMPGRATELLTDSESVEARLEREQLAQEFIALWIEKELADAHLTSAAGVGADLPGLSGGREAVSPASSFAKGQQITEGLAEAAEIKADGSTSHGIQFDHHSRQEEMAKQDARLQQSKSNLHETQERSSTEASSEINATQKSLDQRKVIAPGGINEIQQEAQTLFHDKPDTDPDPKLPGGKR